MTIYKKLSYIFKHVKAFHAMFETSAELDRFIGIVIKRLDCISAPIELGFPANACISHDNVVGHGIPCDSPLKAPYSVDIAIKDNKTGKYADACIMIGEGDIIDYNREAIEIITKQIKPGMKVKDLYKLIISTENEKYKVCRVFASHFIGKRLHDDVIDHVNPRVLKAGDIFTIEPVFVTKEVVRLTDWEYGYDTPGEFSQLENTYRLTNKGVIPLVEV